jgi:hypothetical protein
MEPVSHRKLSSELEASLLEVVDGPFSEWTDADVEDIRREGKATIGQRKGPIDSRQL